MKDLHRALVRWQQVVDLAAGPADPAFYRAVDQALGESVGYKLLTVLRVQGPWLVRLHSSDEHSYPAGGAKDLRTDPWLRGLLDAGEPVLSANAEAVRARFPDHEAIFGLGCAAVLNVPVRSSVGTLGSLNLLHAEGRYGPEDLAVAQWFAPLLGLAWLAHDLRAAQGP